MKVSQPSPSTLRALIAAATPRPWKVTGSVSHVGTNGPYRPFIVAEDWQLGGAPVAETLSIAPHEQTITRLTEERDAEQRRHTATLGLVGGYRSRLAAAEAENRRLTEERNRPNAFAERHHHGENPDCGYCKDIRSTITRLEQERDNLRELLVMDDETLITVNALRSRLAELERVAAVQDDADVLYGRAWTIREAASEIERLRLALAEAERRRSE